ncbi:MAG: sulfatase-like hydrolase/transferase [Spirochaetes bacterium]|nr:sulfatase-like hydrolase/transferase [Spirochaetota bacterium]
MSRKHMTVSRRSFLKAAGMSALALAGGRVFGAEAAASAERPNILWIITDEHRYDTIRAYGKNSWVQSPSLDALAAEGTVFTEAYCQSPLCVASRMSMLTGRYPHNTGVYAFENSHPDIDGAVPFFTELLHKGGYDVVNFGKEHHNRVVSKKAPYDPTGKWFNYLNAFPTKDITPIKRYGIQEEANPSALIKGADREGELGVLRRYLTDKKLIIGGTNPVSAEETLSATLNSRAMEYLSTEAPKDKPLFLRMSYIYPHTPVLPPKPYDTLYDPKKIPLPEVSEDEINGFGVQTKQAYSNLRVHGMKEDEIRKLRADYYGLAAYADYEIGRIIDAFKAYSGKRPWLILFTTDHGNMLGEHGMQEKFTFFDESVHVPLIVASSDGRIPRGKKCASFAELVDLAPTFLAAAGVALPNHLDGKDLADIARGTAERNEVISEKKTYGHRAMLRTKEWSFEMQVGKEPLKGPVLKPADIAWMGTASLAELDVSLFDRTKDPREVRDLGRLPEYQKTCDELRKRLYARIMTEGRIEYDWWQDVKNPPNAAKGK